MKKLSVGIIDIKGNSNSSGELIGHPVRVLNQSVEALLDNSNLCLILAASYKNNLIEYQQIKKILLPFSVKIYTNLIGRIFNIIYRSINLIVLIYHLYTKKFDNYWFINQDNLLLNYLPLSIKKKSVINIYSFNFNIKLIKDFKAVFTSINSLVKTNYLNIHFIPDYINTKKELVKKTNLNDVLIIGSINKDKDIISIIKLFQNIKSTKLYIVGKIFDEDLKEFLLSYKLSDNIIIIDKYITEQDYQNYFNIFLYILLPYKYSSYNNRGSGVYYDCLNNSCIPIIPSFLGYKDGLKFENFNQLSLILSNLSNHNLNKEISSTTKINYVKVIQGLIYEDK
jgi:glycosyltransferase involved in cell wall biosynthesis